MSNPDKIDDMKITVEHPFVLPLNLPSAAKTLEILWIPSGRFLMGVPIIGDEYNEDGPQFETAISKGFWIGQYLITQPQWSAVTKQNPSHFSQNGDDHPVDNINCFQANDFCQQTIGLGFQQKLNGNMPIKRARPPSIAAAIPLMIYLGLHGTKATV